VGKGNGHTKLISFNDATQLVMVLPGKLAKEVRKQFADVIHRYFAGDATLVPEIEANAQSAEPVAQLARETVAEVQPQPAILSEEELARKRRLEDMQIEEMTLRNQRLRAEVNQMQMANVKSFEGVMEVMKGFEPTWQQTMNIRKIGFGLVEDMVHPLAPKISVATPTEPTGILRISTVVGSLGYGYISGQSLQAIGAKLKQLYVDKHGKEPLKESHAYNGGHGPVNVYTHADRELIVEAIVAVMGDAPY